MSSYECPICVAKYHGKFRRYIVCKSCTYRCCVPCVQRYLLTIPDLHCMQCRSSTTLEELSKELPLGFLHNKLYKHHVNLLFGCEKARLKETEDEEAKRKNLMLQKDAEKAKRKVMNVLKMIEHLHDARMALIPDNEGDVSRIAYPTAVKTLRLKAREVTLDSSMHHIKILLMLRKDLIDRSLGCRIGSKDMHEVYNILADRLELLMQEALNEVPEGFDAKTMERMSVPCATSKCPAYISVLKDVENIGCCKSCKKVQCVKCRTILSSTEHECDPSILKTIETIKMSTRPCPKCKEPIEKNEGCNQMFCTSCHTGFDWETLKIIDGPVHNPLYFAWVNRPLEPATTNTPATFSFHPDTHVRLQRFFDGVVNVFSECWKDVKSFVLFANMYTSMLRFWALVGNIQHIVDTDVDPDLYRGWRIGYCRGKFTLEEWKRQLFYHKKRHDFEDALRPVFQRLITGAGEVFAKVHDMVLNTLQVEIESINDFVKVFHGSVFQRLVVCFDELLDVAKRFNARTAQLGQLYNVPKRPLIIVPSADMLRYGLNLRIGPVFEHQDLHNKLEVRTNDVVSTVSVRLNVYMPIRMPDTTLGDMFVLRREEPVERSVHYNEENHVAALKQKALFDQSKDSFPCVLEA